MNSFMDSALLILRIAIGAIFIAHGAQKTFGAFGGPGIQGLTGMMENLGFYPVILWAYVLALSEFVGGILVLFGALPRIGAGLIAIAMFVAIAKVHGPKGFFLAQGGCEYAFLIFMVCMSLILTGAGKFSVFNKF